MTRLVLLTACLAAIWPVAPAAAQVARPRFGITDNSFLVEEAFNQDPGVFQNIFVVIRTSDHHWDAAFTQEWPVGGQRHQLSYTLPFSVVAGSGFFGDVLVNYRVQAWTETGRRPAFAPRLSVLLPSSADRRPLGRAGAGWQINLPFSKQAGAFYVHANVGATWLKQRTDPPAAAPDAWTNAPNAAASVIWAARPMFHLMLEAFAQSASQPDGARENTVIVVPGFRAGWNLGERQVVVGIGAPVTRGDTHDHGLLVYASLELPFGRFDTVR